MTKLEELEATRDAAYDTWEAAADDADDASGARDAAYLDWAVAGNAYNAELKKTKEQTND